MKSKPDEKTRVVVMDATRADRAVARDLARLNDAPHDTPRPARRSRSYADLLERLYTQFDTLADEISDSEAPAHQKADALAKLARTLPLLQQAENAAKTRARGKDLSALTDAELEAEVARTLRASKRGRDQAIPVNPDSPFSPEAGAGSTSSNAYPPKRSGSGHEPDEEAE